MIDDNAPTHLEHPEHPEHLEPIDHSAWGQPIPDDRKATLDIVAQRQLEWFYQPVVSRGASPLNGVSLTGADVFYLSKRARVGPEGDPEAAAVQVGMRGTILDYALPDLHLEGANLAEAHLEGANCIEAHLEQVSLRAAHLQGADIRWAHLEGADIRWAHLEEADLSEASLDGADLSMANAKGARFGDAHLKGAILRNAHLEKADLNTAQLEYADFGAAYMEGVNLRSAHLNGAILNSAQMEGAYLVGAHLESADLRETHLQRAILDSAILAGAILRGSHLQGATLSYAHLEGADLRQCKVDSKTILNDITLDRRTQLGDIQWSAVGAVNLTQITWDHVLRLGDEGNAGWRSPAKDHTAVVRAYRQVAAQLRAQGMADEADRFSYRAQVRQRRVLLRTWRLPQYLFSWLLAILAGYGYRPGRTLLWYVLVVLGYAFAYLHVGPSVGVPLSPLGALVFSVTSFHGRGFFPGGSPGHSITLDDPLTVLAASEAIVGLLIEISFIATFTQRYFGAK